MDDGLAERLFNRLGLDASAWAELDDSEREAWEDVAVVARGVEALRRDVEAWLRESGGGR